MILFNQKRFLSIKSIGCKVPLEEQHNGKNYLRRIFHTSCYIGLILLLYVAMLVGLSVPATPFWVVLFETGLATDVIVENKFSRPLPTKVKCLNWISAGLIAILGTAAITWGVILGDILAIPELGLLLGLSLSVGLAIILSALLHICSEVLVGVSNRLIHRAVSSTRKAQCQLRQYRSDKRSSNGSLNKPLARWLNFHIWSILRKTARGLGLSLLIVFGSIAAGAQGMAVAIIWAIAFTTVISSANRYFPKYFS